MYQKVQYITLKIENWEFFRLQLIFLKLMLAYVKFILQNFMNWMETHLIRS